MVVSGFNDQTLNKTTKSNIGLSKAALVQIDCDLNTSTKSVLAFIEDVIDQGTILMFDDWYAFGAALQEYGEAKAFEEWRMRQCFEPFFDRPNCPSKGFVMTSSRGGG